MFSHGRTHKNVDCCVSSRRRCSVSWSRHCGLSCYNIIYYDLCAYDVTSALHYFIVVVNYRRKMVVERMYTLGRRERERQRETETDTDRHKQRKKIDIAAVALQQYALIIIYRHYNGTRNTGCKKQNPIRTVSFYAPVRCRVWKNSVWGW